MNKVAVVIPHFNDMLGLEEAIASIGDKEQIDVVIVDDGSDLIKIDELQIRKLFKGLGTLIFLYLENNRGIEHALNHGLRYCLKKAYTYTARLDCGDQCHTNRFQKQESYLNKHPSISLIGAHVNFVNEREEHLFSPKYPLDHETIKKKMYVNSMFIHPSVMFRNDILKSTGLYPTNYKAAEDYAFFFDVIRLFKTANMEEVLVSCKLRKDGISIIQRKQQLKNRIKIILKHFYFGFYPIYGLLRNSLLYCIPYKAVIRLKKSVK